MKGRREIDAVADTCSTGSRKYWELHERFVPQACRIGNQIKKGACRYASEPQDRSFSRLRDVKPVKRVRTAIKAIRSDWIIYW